MLQQLHKSESLDRSNILHISLLQNTRPSSHVAAENAEKLMQEFEESCKSPKPQFRNILSQFRTLVQMRQNPVSRSVQIQNPSHSQTLGSWDHLFLLFPLVRGSMNYSFLSLLAIEALNQYNGKQQLTKNLITVC